MIKKLKIGLIIFFIFYLSVFIFQVLNFEEFNFFELLLTIADLTVIIYIWIVITKE